MEFLESTQECDASVTAAFVKAEVLGKVIFAILEEDPALRVMEEVAGYYSLHRSLRLDFINGKPKKAVEHLVSVIRPETLKTLIESKLEMDKSELKKYILEFVAYLKKLPNTHDGHCDFVELKKTGNSGMKNTGKGSVANSRSSGHNSRENSFEVPATRRMTVTERSPDMERRRNRREMDKSELKKDFLEFIKYLEEMAIIHDEHCHVVEQKKTGDSGTKNNGKSSDAGSRSSEHNSGGMSHGGASNKVSDRDRTKSGHERSPESTGTGRQSAREPPPCLNTKKCSGEKHCLSKWPHTGKDEAVVLLSEYKKKRDADKKKANFKTLGNN
jgi:hypothetical protein